MRIARKRRYGAEAWGCQRRYPKVVEAHRSFTLDVKITLAQVLRAGGGTVLTVQQRRCEICGRTVYEDRRSRIIEAARVKSGEEPAEKFIAGLLGSRRRKDADRLADVVQVLKDYAIEGTLEIPRELNELRGELRELKAGDVRLPFYEFTDDSHPKTVTRLTSGFIKKQGETPRHEIDNGLWVIREDRET